MAIVPGNTSEATPGFVTTSISWSHNNDGDILWVAALQSTVSGPPFPIVTATFDSVPMTVAGNDSNGGSQGIWLFYLLAPSAGSHTIAVTSDTISTDFLGAAVSYTGAQQSGVPEALGHDFTVNTTSTTTVTTTHADCWVILAGSTSGGAGGQTITPSTNLVARGTQTTGISGGPACLLIMDSGAQIAAQAYAMTYTASSIAFMNSEAASFEPSAAAASQPGAYSLLLPRSRMREW